jgi:class 3 adenylate cyclase
VVAGVIGRRLFAYDLWGDTVNTASRMETYGVPGRIQVSAATRLALAESFRLEPRGPIAVKGKGMMETYFLLGRRG